MEDPVNDIEIVALLSRTRPLSTVRKRGLFRAPEFIERLPTITEVDCGEPYRLECQIGGFPKPEVVWMKDNIPIVEDDRIQIENEGDVYAIFIKDVEREDEGTYKCRAYNKEGEVASSCYIEVKSLSIKQRKLRHTRSVSVPASFPTITEQTPNELEEEALMEEIGPSPLSQRLRSNRGSLRKDHTWPRVIHALPGEYAHLFAEKTDNDEEQEEDEKDEDAVSSNESDVEKDDDKDRLEEAITSDDQETDSEFPVYEPYEPKAKPKGLLYDPSVPLLDQLGPEFLNDLDFAENLINKENTLKSLTKDKNEIEIMPIIKNNEKDVSPISEDIYKSDYNEKTFFETFNKTFEESDYEENLHVMIAVGRRPKKPVEPFRRQLHGALTDLVFAGDERSLASFCLLLVPIITFFGLSIELSPPFLILWTFLIAMVRFSLISTGIKSHDKQ